MWLSLAPDRFWRQIREVTLITLLNLQPNPFKAWLTTLLETFFPFLKTLGTMRLWPFMNAYLSRFVSKNSNKECYDTLGDFVIYFLPWASLLCKKYSERLGLSKKFYFKESQKLKVYIFTFLGKGTLIGYEGDISVASLKWVNGCNCTHRFLVKTRVNR